jgi:molybdopterin/thiamine biosynthesis adenylyltransferase
MLNQSSKVIVIGCGGIGSWLIPPLLRFLMAAKWKGQVHLIDGDRYEIKNEDRQDFTEEGRGQNKAEAQAIMYVPRYPTMFISAHSEYVSDDNVDSLIVNDSVVFVCVDNHPARARIDRRASQLDTVCVISAGNEESDGNVTVSLRRSGMTISEPLVVRHPEVGETKEHDRAAGCEDLIEEGNIQLLSTNFMAAAIQLMTLQQLWDPKEPEGTEVQKFPQDVYFDILKGSVVTRSALVPEGG